MRYLFVLVLTFMFTGCYETHNKMLSTGKQPPRFFHISSKTSMDRFEFNTERFYFKFPTSKVSDFNKMEGWLGTTSSEGNSISLTLGKKSLGYPYHVSISTWHKASKYGEKARAIENKNVKYVKSLYHKYNPYTDITIDNYGKENYSCVVIEGLSARDRKKYPTREVVTYSCYKFNVFRTKFRKVSTTLTYSKPIDPILAQEYTYEDLKQRAKRMLDSLYITDKW